MKPKIFKNSLGGTIIKTPESYYAFVPALLPPKIDYNKGQLSVVLSRADAALSELSGTGQMLPNPHLLIRPLIRQEAVLSSRIEGTRAGLSDIFLREVKEGSKRSNSDDIREVQNYVAALEYGIQRLRSLPLCLRFICEIHKRLLEGVRGESAMPGMFRDRQNWIASSAAPNTPDSAVYVPPPHDRLDELLTNWEQFIHLKDQMPDLIQCAVMHAQFETIHPFIDGNGRIGRLLICLFLLEKKRLSLPLLYVSAYLEAQRVDYYERLQLIRTEGDWHGWIHYFLKGVEMTARDAASRARSLLKLREDYRSRLQGKARALALIDQLFINPFATIAGTAKKMKASYATTHTVFNLLQNEGIIETFGEQRWGKTFCAKKLLDVIQWNSF